MRVLKILFMVLLAAVMLIPTNLIPVGAEDQMELEKPSRDTNPDFMVEEGVEIPSTDDKRTNKSYYYPVPEGATVTVAEMDISVHPLTEGGNDYPLNPWINIGEGRKEFQHRKEEGDFFQGSWGMNYETVDGLGSSGEFIDSRSLTFSLPKDAIVTDARFNITGYQREDTILQMNITDGSSGNRMGEVIRNLGDVNGDGQDDVLISATGKGLRAGTVYYINSSSLSDRINHYTFADGPSVGAELGTSISGLFNYPDNGRNAVAIGAPYDGIDNKGSVMTYRYSSLIPGFQNVVIRGNTTDGEFGSAVEASDHDNDGSDELFIGAPSDGEGKGVVYLFEQNSQSAQLITVINGSTGETNFGKEMAVIDMDEDGIQDIMIASDQKLRLYLGSESIDTIPDAVYDPLTDSGTTATEIKSVKNLGKTSTSDATLGIGVPTDNGGGVVLYDSDTTIDTSSFELITPSSPIPQFGFSIGSGDMDNDGTNEIAVGAPGPDSARGNVHVYKRGQTLPWQIAQDAGDPEDRFGYDVAIADTVYLNDPFPDILVGAPQRYGTSITGPGIVYRYDYYDLEYLDDNKPYANVEGNLAWTYDGDRLNGTVRSDDISSQINGYISSANTHYGSEFEDFVIFNITFNSNAVNNFKNSSTLYVDDISIVYEQTVEFDDLTREFNNYLINQNRVVSEIDGKRMVLVPFTFSSQSSGRIRIDSINVEYDEVPFVEQEPEEIHIEEDSSSDRVLDLHSMFADDNTPDNNLNISVSTVGMNSSIPDVYIDNGKYLAIDLTNSSDNDGDGYGDYINWSGQFDISFTVMDEIGGQFISRRFTVYVDEVNDPPAVTSLPNGVVSQDEVFTYTPSAVDDEKDEINYTIDHSLSPENMSVDPALGTITWTPNKWEVGNTEYVLVLRDDRDERTYRFALNVIDEPDIPVFLTPPPSVPDGVLEGTTFEYQFRAVDPDIDDRVTYSMLNTPQGAYIDPETGEFTWTPPQHLPQPVEFVIRATDRSGGKTDLEFTLNTTFTDTSPVLRSHPETTLYDSRPWHFDLDFFDAEDHAMEITILELPEGMDHDVIDQNLSWTPGVDQLGEFNLSIRLRSTTFVLYFNYTLEVLRSEREWVLTLEGLSNGETVEGRISFGGELRVSPSDIEAVEIKVGEQNWTTGNFANGRWSFDINTENIEDGTYKIQVRGYDGAIYSETESVTISIKNEEEKTSPLIYVLIVLAVLILIGAILGILFLIKRQKDKKEREEIERRQKEALMKSKSSMDEFLKETGADLDENTDYSQLQIEEEGSSDEELSHIDDIFQPLNIPKEEMDDTKVDSIPEDPLAKTGTVDTGEDGPLMGAPMEIDAVDDNAVQPPEQPPKNSEGSKEEWK